MTYETDWELSSGLRESMDLTIDMAYFSTHAEYNNGNGLLLIITGHDEFGEPWEGRLSLGADWLTADGGRSVSHPTKKNFNKSTNYGHWITASMDIPELRTVLLTRGSPTNASVWENLVIHLELKTITYGRNIDPQEKLLPAGFIGIAGENSQVSATTPLTASTPAVNVPSTGKTPQELLAEARAQSAQVSNGNVSPLHTQMVELAKSHESHASFMAAAFALPEVLADDELAIQVADENGVWAQAH